MNERLFHYEIDTMTDSIGSSLLFLFLLLLSNQSRLTRTLQANNAVCVHV